MPAVRVCRGHSGVPDQGHLERDERWGGTRMRCPKQILEGKGESIGEGRLQQWGE